EEFEDPDGCGESKENKIVGTVLNKLHDEWFKGTDEDDDDLEGTIDYLEPFYMTDLLIRTMKNIRKRSADY
ncbi:hypothetical protein Tco_0096132, partial [Tanacetum coccineum]